MKTLIFSSIIAITSIGNSYAYSTYQQASSIVAKQSFVKTDKRKEAFYQALDFHQWKIDILWNQYRLQLAAIYNSRGGRAELERDKAYFTEIYQKNIDEGFNIENSKETLTAIEKKYDGLLAKRKTLDAPKVVRLENLLRKALQVEEQRFEKIKQANKELIDAETLPRLQALGQYLAQSLEKLNP
ncbi:hypothetical protein GCM10023231_31130 [Olivibacter ginsenosidimutans]|uniref:Sensor of ECF-type sigma factor n=1 Tax=Olivibacter ginsenosidimutans TaxID=1176537 RepID=A0ABP9BW49_9SPHI